MYIDDVVLSASDAGNYSWLTNTMVDIEIKKNTTTCYDNFIETVGLILYCGIQKTSKIKLKRRVSNGTNRVTKDFYLRFYVDEVTDRDQVCKIIGDACEWIVGRDLTFSDDAKVYGDMYAKCYKEIVDLFEEIQSRIYGHTYKWYFQYIDGMK